MRYAMRNVVITVCNSETRYAEPEKLAVLTRPYRVLVKSSTTWRIYSTVNGCYYNIQSKTYEQ